MNLPDTIYRISPVWLQNTLVSLYGWKQYRRRYTGNFSSILAAIEKANAFKSKDTQELQANKLQNIIQHAAENTPFYSNLFAEHGISATEIKTPDDLKRIPVLQKQLVRENPDLFRARGSQRYLTQNTSGSTGTPLSLEVDERTYKTAMALVVNHEQSHGVNFGERRATLAGRMLKPIDDNKPPFSRFNKAENQLLVSSYHINENNFRSYESELNAFQPRLLIGYPSAIYDLASEYQAQKTTPGFNPAIIVTNSETLTEWQRETIESVFKCRVFDYYGTAEYLVFASQCIHHGYHIDPTLGILEITTSDGTPVVDRPGNVVATTLCNYAMPLIRYQIGDCATLSSTPCDCGNSHPHLSSIEGRIDDVILTKDNKRIGRIDHIFKGLSGIREAQVIQESLERCHISVVPADKEEYVDVDALIKNMKARVGSNMHVKVAFTESIPKGANGKFKSVINQM